MSVPKPERQQTLMEVQLEAIALATYTINEAEKDKIVSKRSRWSLGDRLITAALDIVTNIDMANTMRIDVVEEARERIVCQDKAIANIFQLKTLVRIARSKKLFESRIEEHWIRTATHVQDLITAWKESDRIRKRKIRSN